MTRQRVLFQKFFFIAIASLIVATVFVVIRLFNWSRHHAFIHSLIVKNVDWQISIKIWTIHYVLFHWTIGLWPPVFFGVGNKHHVTKVVQSYYHPCHQAGHSSRSHVQVLVADTLKEMIRRGLSRALPFNCPIQGFPIGVVPLPA